MDNKLSEKVAILDDMLQVQFDSSDDSYGKGLYNGIEFARSIIAECQPIYIDKKGELDKEAIANSPERYL